MTTLPPTPTYPPIPTPVLSKPGADGNDPEVDPQDLSLVTCPCCHTTHDLAVLSAAPRRKTYRDQLDTALAELGTLIQGPLPGFRPSRGPAEEAFQRVVQAWRLVRRVPKDPAYAGGTVEEAGNKSGCEFDTQMEGQYEHHGPEKQSQKEDHDELHHEQDDRESGYADAGDRKRVKVEERSDWSNDYPLRPKTQEPR